MTNEEAATAVSNALLSGPYIELMNDIVLMAQKFHALGANSDLYYPLVIQAQGLATITVLQQAKRDLA